MRCNPVGTQTLPHECASTCGCHTRRTFLKSLAAAGASTAFAAPTAGGGGVTFSPTPGQHRRIDVYHQMFPPFLLERWQTVHTRTAAPRWTPSAAMDQMDVAGIETAVLSLPYSGLNLTGLDAGERRRLTRMANDYAARLRSDHPGRFGLFAPVPMPDIDATLREIAYALDRLRADGIGLSARYGSRFLGDPDFKPVLDELQRRGAIVHVNASLPDRIAKGIASSAACQQDTDRTVMSLLFSGAFARTRAVRWIFSHGGTTVPQLADRVNALAKMPLANAAIAQPDGVDFELGRLHYVAAGGVDATDITTLLKVIPTSQVLFGSGFPYELPMANVPVDAAISTTDLAALERGNALRLMPRLQS